MKTLKAETKIAIADQLRSFADHSNLDSAISAIEGLGELGGLAAINHLEELMSTANQTGEGSEQSKWVALLRAYGRAGRFLP